MSTEYFNDQWRMPNNKNQSLVSNYSMEFDGTSDVISVNNSSEALNVDFISISAWYYPTSFVSSSSIISSPNRGSGYHSYNIGLTSNGNLIVILYTGANFEQTFTSAGLLNLNQWNFICMTYDGSNVTVTINTLSQSIARTGALQYTVNPTGNIEIGRRNGTSLLITGNLDQVSIFDYGLSASQVATLYGGGTAVTNPLSLSPKPVAYYQLGDQSVGNGANYLVPNNSLQDYVFQISPSGTRYISIPSITITSAATISVWVNIISFSSATQQSVFGGSPDRLAFFQGGGFVKVLYYDGTASGIITTTLLVADFINKWHHIALVQDGGAATLYIDNSNKGPLGTGLVTPTFINIGTSPIFNGFVSNGAIFNTNLPATGTESVASLYNNGTPPDLSSYSNLERWYKLNAQDTWDGNNWTINDYAGSNDGISVNMTSANLVQSNLQQISGYSPYALDFDGTSNYIAMGQANLITSANPFTISLWFNADVLGASTLLYLNNDLSRAFFIQVLSDGSINFRSRYSGVWITGKTASNTILAGTWVNYVLVYNGSGSTTLSNFTAFLNGSLSTLQAGTTSAAQTTNVGNFIGRLTVSGVGGDYFNGKISNVSIWNAALTSTQVTEVYNSGRPSNLNNHSAYSNLVSWWQLGSNSSFNNTVWTVLDEKGTNDGVSSTNMSNDDIINGPGYSANALGTSSLDIVGDAPYSTANGLSENMDILDRVTDVPS